MSMQSFRFIRFEDKKLTLGGGVHFTPLVKPTYMKKLLMNRIKQAWLLDYWALHDIYCSPSFPTKIVQWIARMTRSFLCKAFPAFKAYCLQSLGFLLQKRVFKQRLILSKGCQNFNGFCCHCNSVKRKMTGLFVCRGNIYESSFSIIAPPSVEDSWL